MFFLYTYFLEIWNEDQFQVVMDLKQKNCKQKERVKDLEIEVDSHNFEIQNLKDCIEKLMRQNTEMLRKNSALQKQGRGLIYERSELLRRLDKTEETNFRLRQLLSDTSRACKDMETQRVFLLNGNYLNCFILIKLALLYFFIPKH